MTDVLGRLTAALADRYAIERELGAGGMATVYLAHDVRHDRQVALKVLRPELASILGAERFLTEIRTTANLQHPHILPLFDSGEADGLVFYVMPYVEGESLRDRLTREKQLPVEDAVSIAQQVLDALEYAHGRGVIHRDVKPENVLLHGGNAVIADFGIALAVSRSNAVQRLTGTGLSVGTPAYMSPEQAMGERILTACSDIYSAGCVLYEMLAGEPPFPGANAQAITALVLTEKPPSLVSLRRTVPAHVAVAVDRALEKLPADRFATARDFAAALRAPAFAYPRSLRAHAGLLAAARLRTVPWALATVATIVAGVALARRAARPAPVARLMVAFDGAAAPTDELALTPDGTVLVYVGGDSAGSPVLYRRALDRLESTALAGTVGIGFPTFSPDGEWIAFLQGLQLRRIPAGGGGASTICDLGPGDFYGLTWIDRATLVFSARGRLYAVAATGGQPIPVPLPKADSAAGMRYRWPAALGGGREVLVGAVRGDTSRLAVVSLRDGRRTDLGVDGIAAQWVNHGYIAFVQTGGQLAAVTFDPRRLKITGVQQALDLTVAFDPVGPSDPDSEPIWAVSAGGMLAALQRSRPYGEIGRVVRVDRAGAVRVLSGIPSGWYEAPRYSPDGRHLAVATHYGSAFRADVWVYELGASTALRLTLDSASGEPAWTPDGRRLVFSGLMRGGLWRVAADGAGGVETLVAKGQYYDVQPTPDGRTFVFRNTASFASSDLFLAPTTDPGTPRPLTQTPFAERWLALSPDGRWLAYASDETGRFEVYVRTLDPASPHWRVSRGGGTEPRWAHSGRELFFRAGDTMLVAAIAPGIPFHAGAPRPLFGGRFESSPFTARYDVTPDDRGFVMVQPVDTAAQANRIALLLNWFDTPARRVP